MPTKGFSTQGVMVLTETALSAKTIDKALARFKVVKRMAAEGKPNWMSGYPAWIVEMRKEVNGYLIVDVIDAAWPDSMGDPKEQMELFAAWSMGFMGPHTWPGALERAAHYARGTGQEFVAEAADCHRAFVRVRSSYVLGTGDDAKIWPEDYDAGTELEFVNNVALALAEAEGALCYFNPGGETLHTAASARELLKAHEAAGYVPVPLWSSQRLVHLEDAPGWALTDTIGMEQVMAMDHEACFPEADYDSSEVMDFIRNTAIYTMQSGPVIKDGETTDGPGGIWRAMEAEESMLPMPRAVLRWAPDGVSLPKALRKQKRARTDEPEAPKAGAVGRLKRLFGSKGG
jgi:hypothetical protein